MKWGAKAKPEGKQIFERARKENRSSLLVEAYLEIVEIDLNPVIIHKKGIRLVDARILLK